MARLDYFTIIIGAICLAAAAFLVYIGINKFRTTDSDSEANSLYNDLQTYDEDDQGSYYVNQDDLTKSTTTNINSDKSSTSSNTSTTPSNDEDLEYDFLDETPKKSSTSTKGSTSSRNNTSTTTTRNTNTSTSTRTTVSDGDYMVLAGSFREKANAEQEAARLRKLGFSNTSVERFDKGTYSVILVDRFDARSGASKLKEKLATKGVDSYVKLKR